MKRYENYLEKSALYPKTTSFYMPNLRAIYNQAVEQGLTPQNDPFTRVYTGIAKTVKRAVNIEEVQKSRLTNCPQTLPVGFRTTNSCSVSASTARR